MGKVGFVASMTFHPQASQSEDEAAVRGLYTQRMDGWNKGSGEAFPLHSPRTAI